MVKSVGHVQGSSIILGAVQFTEDLKGTISGCPMGDSHPLVAADRRSKVHCMLQLPYM